MMHRLALLSLLVLPLAAQQEQPAADSHSDIKTKKVVHELVLSGVYKDLPSPDLSIMSLLAGGELGAPKAFYELIEALRKIAPDTDGGGEALLDLSRPALVLNPAQLSELARVMAELRGKGIRLTAYLENATMAHYRVAALCDRVVMAEMGHIDFKSPSLSVLFLRGAMDLLGIEMQVVRCGDFKGAVEPYMLERMSDHLRAHYRKMLKSINDEAVQTIGTRRRLEPERVLELQARRLLSAREAKEAGLVDDIVPWQGAHHAMAASEDAVEWKTVQPERKKKGFNIFTLFASAGGNRTDVTEPSFAVLHLSGPIVDGTKEVPGSIVSGPTVKLIRSLAEDADVEGVVVRVNSPGGSATASEAVLLALKDLRARKPVVVSMGELAASGGYWISMVGGPVLAEQGTITGSIGVFGMRPNLAGLGDLVGIHEEVVGLDDGAALDDLFSPLSESRLAQLQQLVDEVYVRFQDHILETRKGLDRKTLLGIAGGRVWSGAQAKELGLVDEIGGLDAALTHLEKDCGKNLPVVHRPVPETNPFAIIENLLGDFISLRHLKVELLRAAGHDLSVPLNLLLDALHHPGACRVWALLPADLHVR